MLIRRKIIIHPWPYRRLFMAAVMGFLLASALLLGFYLGQQQQTTVSSPSQPVSAEPKHLLAMADARHAIDQDTISLLRTQLVEQLETIALMESELQFFKDIMAPEDVPEGGFLRAPLVTPVNATGRWRYEVIVQQGARASGRHEGQLRLALRGQQGDQPLTLTQQALAATEAAKEHDLRFRYFQRVQGEWQLPPQFTPAFLDVELVMTQPKATRQTQSYAWDDIRGKTAAWSMPTSVSRGPEEGTEYDRTEN
jgi:hypothetical protein